MKRDLRLNEPMARHTTFRIGGPAERFFVPSGIGDLRAFLEECPREEPITLIGAGSNLLVSDDGIPGTVIHLGAFQSVRLEENRLLVGAGVMLPGLLQQLAREGLGGLEFLGGIPGTVGGGVRMNAGTEGGWMADRLLSVTYLHPSGALQRTRHEEITFGYRRMALPAGACIVGAEFRLEPDDPMRIAERLRERMAKRRKTQPVHLASAGCIFKNPPGDAAGRLIEAAGLKGARIGDAEVSPLHANFVVNRGKARASDVLSLIRRIQERVREETGLDLEFEIEMIGVFEKGAVS
jgi:UDP-N-acetylmuramate dehydrogenase